MIEAEKKEKGKEVKEYERKQVKEENSVRVDKFVNERILQPQNAKNGLPIDERISNLNLYFQISEQFHQPKGEGYKLVLHCLQKYLDFKFIRENNQFRFRENLFDRRVEVLSESEHAGYPYMVSDQGPPNTMDGTKADIYYLLHEADQEGIASRRCISYVNSNKLHLTAVLIQLIERIVENLEKNQLKKYREYGLVIRTAYMSIEYADLDVFSIFELVGFSKKKYYRIRNAAITLISETLFGILAGEHGFADLYIENDEIRVLQQ